MDLFKIDVKAYQSPAFVARDGSTKIQAMYSIVPIGSTSTNRAVILVLDFSGSMGGEGEDALRPASKSFLGNIPNGVIVGILVFSGRSQIHWLAPPAEMTDQARVNMQLAIDQQAILGTTCFGTTLQTAVDALSRLNVDIKEIDFFTDGNSMESGHFVAAAGKIMDDSEEALFVVEQAATQGIAFNMYGMGVDYNFAYMQQLTAAAHGTFYHVLSNGDGLDQLMTANAIRFGNAVAGNMKVEIALNPGFTFGVRRGDTSGKPWVIRKNPTAVFLTPIVNGTLVLDTEVGTVNSIEGIKYDMEIVGSNLTVQTNDWSMPAATLRLTYTAFGGQQQQVLILDQQFTTVFGNVKSDNTVRDTMSATHIQTQVSGLLKDLTAAQTMGDAQAIQRLTAALTQAKSVADANSLGPLSVSIGDAIAGISDEDQARRNATMFGSADLGQLTGGMSDG